MDSTRGGIAQASATSTDAQTVPPIVEIFHLAVRLSRTGLNRLWDLTRLALSFSNLLLTPIKVIYSILRAPIAYLLSPIFILASILLNIFIVAPYTILVGLIHEVYPIYTFVVIAVICAALIGLCARGVTGLVQSILREPVLEKPAQDIPGEPPVMKTPQSDIKKRVKVKEEPRSRSMSR